MLPAVEVALDEYAESAARLVEALLEALAGTVRERYPSAAVIRLELDWTQDHRLVVADAEIEDDTQRLLVGSDEFIDDPRWFARLDEILACLAEVRGSDMDSDHLLVLP